MTRARPAAGAADVRRLARPALAAALAAGVLAARPTHAQYTFAPISVPGAGATAAFGVNNAGQVVGFYGGAGGFFSGFLYSAGTYTTIHVPGATNTVAAGINAAGQVVGAYNTDPIPDGSNDHAFLYDAGTGAFTFLPDVPGSIATAAIGINGLGQIVGTYRVPAGRDRAFLYSGGVYTTLPVPSDVVAARVNDAGQVAGAYLPRTCAGDNFCHGFLYSGGVLTTIDVPGAAYTGLFGINDAGRMVGAYVMAARQHGLLYDGSVFTPFDAPGAVDTWLTGINDVGQLVGFYSTSPGLFTDADPPTFSFLATPTAVPEPATLALLAAGVGLLGAVARRRRRPGG